jgi:ankyrin repeat protein
MTKDTTPLFFYLFLCERMERRFFDHLWKREQDEALEMIKNHPELDLMWISHTGGNLLHHACSKNCHRIVPILLKVPDIDVNRRDDSNLTPFIYACVDNSVESLALLLDDPRFDMTSNYFMSIHPLIYSRDYCEGLIVIWVTSGRPIKPRNAVEKTIVGLKAIPQRQHDVKLLESYLEHPEHAVFCASVELKKPEYVASLFFAPLIFLSDGLLQLKEESDEQSKKAARFLNMARTLPMELQMMLCYRAAGSTKNSIPSKVAETAFQRLAQVYNDALCSCFC